MGAHCLDTVMCQHHDAISRADGVQAVGHHVTVRPVTSELSAC